MNEKDYKDLYEFIKSKLSFRNDKAIAVYMATHQSIVMQMYDEWQELRKNKTL